MPRVLQKGQSYLAQVAEVGPIREITRADLSVLASPRPQPTVKTLRDNHHRIARALASGLSNDATAKYCGVSFSRISMLKADPAFQDLVAHYRGLVTAQWLEQQDHFMEIATSNMLKAEAMLSDKLDDAMDKGEFLPTRDLVAITGDRADRFGYGKTHKNVNFNVDFAAKLEAARTRSSKARVIEGEVTSRAPNLVPAEQQPELFARPVSSLRRL